MMDFFEYMQWKERTERRLEPYYYRKVNKRLKYAMYASIGICIILLVSQSFFLDPMDYRKYTVLLWLRGFAGIFGLIFFILTGILVYRVNAEYFKDRAKIRKTVNFVTYFGFYVIILLILPLFGFAVVI